MITSLIASLIALLYLKITFRTIRTRRELKISLGSGDDQNMINISSAHNNFNNYAPIFLILMLIIEIQKFIPETFLFFVGIVFLIGRFLHFKALTAQKMDFKNRVRGMVMTLIPIMILIVINLFCFVKGRYLTQILP